MISVRAKLREILLSWARGQVPSCPQSAEDAERQDAALEKLLRDVSVSKKPPADPDVEH